MDEVDDAHGGVLQCSGRFCERVKRKAMGEVRLTTRHTLSRRDVGRRREDSESGGSRRHSPVPLPLCSPFEQSGHPSHVSDDGRTRAKVIVQRAVTRSAVRDSTGPARTGTLTRKQGSKSWRVIAMPVEPEILSVSGCQRCSEPSLSLASEGDPAGDCLSGSLRRASAREGARPAHGPSP